MSLNPLSIAHLGIARRPIVAALLGIWDELMLILTEEVREHHGGAGGGDIKQRERTNKRNKYLKQQMMEEGEIAIILNVLLSQGIIR